MVTAQIFKVNLLNFINSISQTGDIQDSSVHTVGRKVDLSAPRGSGPPPSLWALVKNIIALPGQSSCPSVCSDRTTEMAEDNLNQI